MAVVLDKLTPEIISLVCSHLDIASLCSLRLTSKSFKAKSRPEFRRYLETQNIDLTTQGLQRLCSLASCPGLSSGVRNLNLTCLYYRQSPKFWGSPTPGELHASRTETISSMNIYAGREFYCDTLSSEEKERDGMWMAERLAEQAALTGENMCQQLSQALSNFGSLDLITLEASIFCGPKKRYSTDEVSYLPWRNLWARAIQAFRVVISAIARSQINLKSLVIYQKTNKCSIPTSEIAGPLLAKLQEEGFATVGDGLRSFSLSLATTVVPVRPPAGQQASGPEFYAPFDISSGRQLDASNPIVEANANAEGAARLFAWMPNLECLDIQLYNTTTCTSTIPEELPYQAFLKSLFQNTSFPHLTSLTLQGLPATTETMTNIFSQHPRLQFLSLQNMFLTSGSWDLVLAAAIRTCTSLAHIHLRNLWRPGVGKITNLDYSGSTTRKLNPLDPGMGLRWFKPGRDYYVWHTRDVKKVELDGLGMVDFDPTAPVWEGYASWKSVHWLLTWRRECGPPQVQA